MMIDDKASPRDPRQDRDDHSAQLKTDGTTDRPMRTSDDEPVLIRDWASI